MADIYITDNQKYIPVNLSSARRGYYVGDNQTEARDKTEAIAKNMKEQDQSYGPLR